MKEDLEILVRRTLRDGKWTAPQVTVADDLPISTDRVIDRVMRERKDRPLASGEQPSESGTTNTDEDTTLGEPPTELTKGRPGPFYMAAIAACLLVIGGSFMLLTQNAETNVDDDVTQPAPVTTGDDPPGSASSVEPSGQEIPAASPEPPPAETFERAVNELPGLGDELDIGPPGEQFCLNVPDYDIREGTDLQMWPCDGSAAQKFVFAERSILHHSGLCVGVEEEFGNGSDVELQQCANVETQRWTARIELSGDDDIPKWYKFEVGPNYCLDRRDGHERGVSSGMAVQIWSCNGRSDNKEWH